MNLAKVLLTALQSIFMLCKWMQKKTNFILQESQWGSLRKNFLIWIFSCLYFLTFGLNREKRYGVFLHIQSEYGEIRTRKTPNTNTWWVEKNVEVTLARIVNQFKRWSLWNSDLKRKRMEYNGIKFRKNHDMDKSRKSQ